MIPSLASAEKGKRGRKLGSISERIFKLCMPEPNSGCWLWLGRVHNGYGVFKIGRRAYRAHRESYRAFVGEIGEGRLVCHKCDVPLCVNPAHLYAGTPADNVADMHRRGRWARKRKGEFAQRIAQAPNPALEARKCVILAADVPHDVIALAFGMDRSTISRIKRGELWAKVGALQ